MYGNVKYDSAPHTAHQVSTSPTSSAKSSPKKAVGGKKIPDVETFTTGSNVPSSLYIITSRGLDSS
jgi:hypothetical protein